MLSCHASHWVSNRIYWVIAMQVGGGGGGGDYATGGIHFGIYTADDPYPSWTFL